MPLWLLSPDQNGSCCGCNGRQGPCDPCSTCTPESAVLTNQNNTYPVVVASNPSELICKLPLPLNTPYIGGTAIFSNGNSQVSVASFSSSDYFYLTTWQQSFNGGASPTLILATFSFTVKLQVGDIISMYCQTQSPYVGSNQYNTANNISVGYDPNQFPNYVPILFVQGNSTTEQDGYITDGQFNMQVQDTGYFGALSVSNIIWGGNPAGSQTTASIFTQITDNSSSPSAVIYGTRYNFTNTNIFAGINPPYYFVATNGGGVPPAGTTPNGQAWGTALCNSTITAKGDVSPSFIDGLVTVGNVSFKTSYPENVIGNVQNNCPLSTYTQANLSLSFQITNIINTNWNGSTNPPPTDYTCAIIGLNNGGYFQIRNANGPVDLTTRITKLNIINNGLP